MWKVKTKEMSTLQLRFEELDYMVVSSRPVKGRKREETERCRLPKTPKLGFNKAFRRNTIPEIIAIDK